MAIKEAQIKPKGKQVFVKVDSDEMRESEYGILTPKNVEQEKKSTGLVIAVGPDVKGVKKGEKVIFAMFAGDPIKLENKDYKFILEEDILSSI